MAGLSFNHVYKVYDAGVEAVKDFCLEASDGEFIVLVGPSGSGKTTVLRMIAGLEEITAGQIIMDGEILNKLKPKDRGVAMVSQRYALLPHYTVYKNMALGLNAHKTPKAETDKRITEAAEFLGLTDYLSRKPNTLSGGQRQRVALGRAVVTEPKVFILDEPLSNLDAKLRTEMRAEIIKIFERVKTTFIYVTHDQIEAMTMADRIVVMNEGKIQQAGTPREIYANPANKFVAGFIGTPQMNFFDCTLCKDGGYVSVDFAGYKNKLESACFSSILPALTDGHYSVEMGVRPEDILYYGESAVNIPPNGSDANIPPNLIKANVLTDFIEDLGGETLIYGNFAGKETNKIVVKIKSEYPIKRGDVIEVYFNPAKLHFFDKNSGESLKTICP